MKTISIHISLTLIFLQIAFLVICAFQKQLFYNKIIKYSNKYNINSGINLFVRKHVYALNKLQILSTLI